MIFFLGVGSQMTSSIFINNESVDIEWNSPQAEKRGQGNKWVILQLCPNTVPRGLIYFKKLSPLTL